MNYRIRYRQAGQDMESEAIIEANSPAEAVVKFRCTRGSVAHPVGHDDQVISVSAAEKDHQRAW